MSNNMRDAMRELIKKRDIQHPEYFTPDLYRQLPMLQTQAIDIIMKFRRDMLANSDRAGAACAENRLFEELSEELHKMPDTKHYYIDTDRRTIQLDEVAIQYSRAVLRGYFTEQGIDEVLYIVEQENINRKTMRIVYETVHDQKTKALKDALKAYEETGCSTLAALVRYELTRRKAC